MVRQKIHHHTDDARLAWKVYGERDDKAKVTISKDGLNLQVTDAVSTMVKCATSEPIRSEEGDPFYFEFHLVQAPEPPMNIARGHRYDVCVLISAVMASIVTEKIFRLTQFRIGVTCDL